MPLKNTLIPVFSALLLAGCTADYPPRPIERLDVALAEVSMSKADSAAFESWSKIAAFEGQPEEYAGRTAPFEALVISSISSLDSVEQVLGNALADRPDLQLIGIVSPYNQTVVTDSEGRVFIALNHYLGAASKAYAGFPEYIRRRKVLQRLPIDVVTAVIASESAPEFTESPTLLNRLLYQGALLNLTLKALPDETTEAALLGMTDEEYQWCAANEASIWNAIIERKWLFSTDPEISDRLLRPAPATALLNPEAPGQALLYTALKIAQTYEKATGKAAVLSPEYYNNNSTLTQSEYTPANATR